MLQWIRVHWQRHERKYLTSFKIALGVFLAFVVNQIPTESIESYLYDLRVALRPSSSLSGNIEIVRVSGSPRVHDYKIVIEKIAETIPKAIVLTFDLSTVTGSPDELKDLADSLKRNSVIVANKDPYTEADGKIKPLKPPFEKIAVVPAPKTIDQNVLSKDLVTRRQMLKYQGQLTMHPLLASLYNPDIKDLHRVRGIFEFYASDQVFINYHPKGSFKTTKFQDLLTFEPTKNQFANKIVLIGNDPENISSSFIRTPYDHSINAMTVTEMHANMIETLITNSAPIRSPAWLDLLISIFISILTVHVVLTLKPLKGILVVLSMAATLLICAYLSFWPFGFWVGISHPLLQIFLCYYFFIPYRLIVENRKSWEYYHKHKLLSEVETLKTNFIGMMSHDLKTPLARIQGMAELIGKDSISALSLNQREALDTIKQSAEDLTKFISTILNYAQIESHGVELHLQGRDINELIKDIVKKTEFLAKLKHIQIITELEPLFAIRVDPELLKQVFTNLIENAIKYSPENSKVLISTEEVDEKILIQIADQGIGIPPDELPNIFMKFFRSKNVKISAVKGSGLGLYLARYFVELHKGSIQCESSVNQGSTFTVELPILR